ncbi:peroxisomal carnitine O-octanoyltransferase isoform X1 [Phlebotomus argentipes]|uniref:peroxisomal carnitine O-octanoyltransferase isoform X1 n=1 Tax=Phlebotomus argentipes TaxID=94469 RepID=UPI00289361BC|nr:peroxisomal carnitine O-octanoyltransferase isoform X1 [Phlebotomus argentipes]
MAGENSDFHTMQRRNMIFVCGEDDPSTFEQDDLAPALPLPSLDATLERYYDCLKPFGTQEELKTSRATIEAFRNGIGGKLQAILEKKAQSEKNWVAKYWEDYAYLCLRMPLLPFCGMIHPFNLPSAGIPETPEMALKTTAWMFHHIIEFWKLLRQERVKSGSTSAAPLTSFLHRRLYNSCRLPGEKMDSIWSAFKTEKEGDCPSHSIILYQGRMFVFDCVDEKGDILSPQQYLAVFTAVKDIVTREKKPGDCVGVLTSDDRTNWAVNRKRLLDMSSNNRKVLELIDSGVVVINLDDQCPSDYSEAVADIMGGDLVQRWSDKSLNYVSFANGKIGCVGEHTCFDGTIAVHLSSFLLESLSSGPEPDWKDAKPLQKPPIELIFDLDECLRDEITRMKTVARKHKLAVGVDYSQFMDFGKEVIKAEKIHPDSFVQLALLLTFHRIHGQFAPTYETALMRNYYRGRTETVRSCSEDAVKWIKCMVDAEASIPAKVKLFKVAAKRQTQLMNDARSGRGIDRHLFALWCIAYENGFEIPKLYDDPLYSRSGGGGNFILSTSTLGFNVCGGCVAPMCLDGYGCFYNILPNSIILITTVFNDSTKTNCKKFTQYFQDSLRKMREILDLDTTSKL